MEEKEFDNILKALFRVEESCTITDCLEALIAGGRKLAELRAKYKKLSAKRDGLLAQWKAADAEGREAIEAQIARSEDDDKVSEAEIVREM